MPCQVDDVRPYRLPVPGLRRLLWYLQLKAWRRGERHRFLRTKGQEGA